VEQMYVGIDVSKETLDVSLRWDAKNQSHKVFENNSSGISQLIKWLVKQKAVRIHACLEATGQYGDEVAERLHQQTYAVSVVNPLCTKSYARARLVRNQTDKVDAGLLAEYCEQQKPRLWVPPTPLQKTLRGLSRRIDDLEVMRQAERNRLKASKSLNETLRQSLQTVIDCLTQELLAAKKALSQLLAQDPELLRQKKLLMSIKGVGELTAVRFLAELGDLRAFADARQLAAFLGLTPEFKTSGKSVHSKPRMSKRGNANVRKMLYMPAVSAKNTNPIVREFCARLALSRKCDMSLIGAAMHKLAHLMFGVVHSGIPFDPDYLKIPQVAS
jgi:transposase